MHIYKMRGTNTEKIIFSFLSLNIQMKKVNMK